MNKQTDELGQIMAALEYARLDAIRSDICKFAEYAMRDEKGQKFTLAPHHIEWYEFLWDMVKDIVEPDKHPARPKEAKNNAFIMAPREHGKTSTMVSFLCYILGKNPNLRVKYVSGSSDLAEDVLGLVKRNIEANAELLEIFPNLKPDSRGDWSGSSIDVMKVDVETGVLTNAGIGIKDHSLQAYGITAPATGGRADLIIFDDIIRSREAIQEPARLETIAKMFFSDWMNIGGYRHIVIGTPWTPDDVHSQLSKDDEWLKWKKPAIINGEPLWPARWPIEKLLARKKMIGEMAFDLQFMLMGIRDKVAWWSTAIVDKCKDENLMLGQMYDSENKIVASANNDDKKVVLGVDPASSLKGNGSWSCLTAVSYDDLKRKTIVEIRRLRASPRAIAENVVEMYYTHKFKLILVENNATQQAFVDLINLVCENRHEQITIPMRGQFTGSQKWNPETGLPRLVTSMENGNYSIPFAGHDEVGPLHECVICHLIKELLGYPYDTETTDMVMSLWLADTAIEQQSLIGNLPTTIRANKIQTGW